MKNLIKIFTVIVLVVLFTVDTQAQVKFGVKAGVNFNDIAQNIKSNELEFDSKMGIGYHAGALIDYSFNEEMGLQSGIIWNRKGFDADGFSYYGFDIDADISAFLNYIEIPLHFVYKLNSFQFYAGPYFAFGLGGVMEVIVNNNNYDIDVSRDIELIPVYGEVDEDDYDNDEMPVRGFDYGIDFGLGYELGPVLLNAGYSIGLGNITPNYTDPDIDPKDEKRSNRVITVSVAYMFGK
ncbi:MAG: porin family protein [Bacteroidota bacterium]